MVLYPIVGVTKKVTPTIFQKKIPPSPESQAGFKFLKFTHFTFVFFVYESKVESFQVPAVSMQI
jgi:hypothetical protein